MPRDIAGNYTLPSGNPVIAHETIEANWANTTMPDIAAALTDSLSRNGNGGMLVPFKFIDGSVGAPGITFANEPTSGIYRAGLNDVRVSIGVSDVMKFTPAGVTIPAGKTLSGAISVGTINGTPIGGTAPSTGSFTTLAANSIATPIIGTDTDVAFQLKVNAAGRWVILPSANAYSFVPGVTNSYDLGSAALTVRSGYFGTSVVSPIHNSGADVRLNMQINGVTKWLFGNAADTFAFAPNTDNSQDLGLSIVRLRSGYFGTSVVCTLFDSGGAVDMNFRTNGVSPALALRHIPGVIVNTVTIQGGASGSAPAIGTLNSADANVGLSLYSKGTGTISILSQSGSTTLATFANSGVMTLGNTATGVAQFMLGISSGNASFGCKQIFNGWNAGGPKNWMIENGTLGSDGLGFFASTVSGGLAFAATASFLLRSDGSIQHPLIGTTGTAGNCFLDGADANRMFRSTSSLRYKRVMGDLTIEEARSIVLRAKPIVFKPLDAETQHIGLAAEWMAEIDERTITRDAEGRPDWVQYPHLTVPLMLVVQDIDQRLARLEARP